MRQCIKNITCIFSIFIRYFEVKKNIYYHVLTKSLKLHRWEIQYLLIIINFCTVITPNRFEQT